MALAFFIISSFDLLSGPSASSGGSTTGAKQEPLLAPEDLRKIRDWVFSLRHPNGGFCGSPNHVPPPNAYDGGQSIESSRSLDTVVPGSTASANIAATYFALLLLAIAAETEESAAGVYAGIDRAKTLRWLRRLQRPDGSFGELVTSDGQVMGGRDMRYCYLAASIRWCLRGDVKEGDRDWVEDIDVEGLVRHIRASQVRSLRSLETGDADCDNDRPTMEALRRAQNMNRTVTALL